MKVTVYGEGGYDPDKPNNNIIEEYEVEDPPAPVDEVSVEDRIAELEDQLAALRAQVE